MTQKVIQSCLAGCLVDRWEQSTSDRARQGRLIEITSRSLRFVRAQESQEFFKRKTDTKDKILARA